MPVPKARLGVLGISEGGDHGDTLLFDAGAGFVPTEAELRTAEELTEGLAETLADVPEADAGMFRCTEEGDARGEEEPAEAVIRRLVSMSTRAAVDRDAEIGMLEAAGELDRRGLMSPDGWVRMDGRPWPREAMAADQESLFSMVAAGIADVEAGDAPWGDDDLDDVTTAPQVMATAVAMMGWCPDESVVGVAARDLRMAGHDIDGWEGFLPARGVFGMRLATESALAEGAEEEDMDDASMPFIDRAEGEDPEDSTSFGEWGEAEPSEGESDGSEYVRCLETGKVGQIVDSDTADPGTPDRVQWEDGETEWIDSGDESRYERF